jgi:type III pantothenate kinase
MILVVDVGNTNIVLGVYDKEKLAHHWRLYTDKQKTEDEFGMLIKGLFREEGLVPQDMKGIIISSVVPQLMLSLENMCHKYFNIEPMVVGPGIKTGLSIHYDNPREVGSDRIVNAVAALEAYTPPLVIVDFGTATTFCYVDEKGRYMGGAIAPGIQISTHALYANASKLPRIELKVPERVVGKNTVSAMQSGILFGYSGLVDSIITRMKQQSKIKPTVIATGGLAELICGEAKQVDIIDPFLTLKGLYSIYHKNS